MHKRITIDSTALSPIMPLKFVCISIFCFFCLFGRTQLPAVNAVPFEYNEDHEQYPYDLETEQLEAKYDAHLLSEQLQQMEKSIEEPNEPVSQNEERSEQKSEHEQEQEHNNKDDDDNYNDEQDEKEKENEDDGDNDDMQPHERAASCFTRKHKYSHGQKIQRKDPCEVCLCMDGEIFCWWEKCEIRKSLSLFKKRPKQSSKPYHSEMKSIQKSAITPIKSPKQIMPQKNSEFKTHNENSENNRGYKMALKQQKQFDQKRPTLKNRGKNNFNSHFSPSPSPSPSPSSSFSSSLSSSKIMNFPENLPSVLYYDYHTEEHEHHQHEHHQQNLKHQLQKKILKLQHENNRQSQRQQQKQKQLRQQKLKNFTTDSTSFLISSAVTPPIQTPHHSNNNRLNRSSVLLPAMYAYDDLQTDSDILPEPPTKKPKLLPQAPSSSSSLERTSTDLNIHAKNATFNSRQKSNLYENKAKPIMKTEWRSRNNEGVHRLFVGETSATSSIFATDNVVEMNKNSSKTSPEPLTLEDFKTLDTKNSNNYNNNNNNNDKNNNNNKSNNENINNMNKINNDNSNINSYRNSYATENTEYENPFGIQALEGKAQKYTPNKNKSKNKGNKNNSRNNKIFNPENQERDENFESGFLHGVNSNDYGDYNGSVNIDILLTTQDELSQLNIEKQRENLREKLPKTPASIIFAADLILNRDGFEKSVKAINNRKTYAKKLNGSTPEDNVPKNSNSNQKNFNVATTVMTTTMLPQKSNIQIMRENSTELVRSIEQLSGTTEKVLNTERHCNVMGTLYKIGEVLPQDTGNCLQCICIDGSTGNDTPRVTCSPHNCPPLVLPDLFDATGY